jgi:basic amino acid/polyamine antiporter, APA family
VTVAIPHLFSACAQLKYLVSRRPRVQGWRLGRDLAIAGASGLLPLWITFAAGYQAVYQALVLVLAGIVLYAFVAARRQPEAQSQPADLPSWPRSLRVVGTAPKPGRDDKVATPKEAVSCLSMSSPR